MKDGTTLTWRVNQLEKQFGKHNDVLFGENGILTNEIPHIHEQLSSIKTRVAVLSFINLGALVTAILFKYL